MATRRGSVLSKRTSSSVCPSDDRPVSPTPEPDEYEPMAKKKIIEDADDELADATQCEALTKIYLEIRAFRREAQIRHNALVKRLDALEAQTNANGSSAFPTKPDCLPLRTRTEIAAFETVNQRQFDEVVDFLGSLSSGTIQERVNTIVKDAMDDDLAPELTVQGGEPNSTKIEGTRFSDALYAAVCKDIPRSERPARRVYVVALTSALKAAKQRYRRLHPKKFSIAQ